MWVRGVLAVAVGLTASCGDDGARPAAGTDAAADVSSPDAGTGCAPRAPRSPAPPVLTPCPMGWLERAPALEGEPATCDPWPGSGPDACAALDEVHFPGEPGCTRVGTGCPADGWPTGLPSGRPVRYVRPGADPASATGRKEHPFATILAARTGARPDTIFALAPGTYDERVVLYEGQALWGACVAETLLTFTHPEDANEATVLGYAPRTEVRNLRLGGDGGIVLAVSGFEAPPGVRHTLHVEDVVVDDALATGLRVEHGALLTGRSVAVRHARGADPARYDMGGLFVIGDDARAELERWVVLAGQRVGVDVRRGATARLLDGAVVGVAVLEGASLGVFTIDRSALELERAAVVGTNVGVQANEGSTLRATDLVVRDPVGDAPAYGAASFAATVELSRAVVAGRTGLALVAGPSGRLAAGDVLVADTRSLAADFVVDGVVVYPGGTLGMGLAALPGSDVALERVALRHQQHVGLFAEGWLPGLALDPPTVSLRDVSIRETEPAPGADRLSGRALHVQDGVALRVERVEIAGAREVGLGVYASRLEGTDVVVRDVAPTECDGCDRLGGIGLGVYSSGLVTVERLVVERSSLAGVQMATGGTGSLREVHIDGSTVGVSLSTEGLGADEALSCVAFADVEQDVQARELAVPPPVESLDLGAGGGTR